MLKESLSRFKLKPNSSEASKVDSIRPEVMRMLEDMVEKKMSSHHLDESKHKGKGTRNLRQKLKYCWTTKSLASIDVLEALIAPFCCLK